MDPERNANMRMMLVIWSLPAILAFTGILNAEQQTGPKIVVKEVRYDSGKVTQGTPVSHVFEIANEGTETLVIERVQPG